MATEQKPKNTLSEYLAPGAFNIAPSHIQIGDKFARTVFLATYPRYLQTNWFSPVINLDRVFDVSVFVLPKNTSTVLKQLRDQLTRLEAQAMEESAKGKVRDPILETAINDIEVLRDRLQQGTDKFFELGIYITIYEDSLKEHIYKGYTINRNRIQKNYAEFLKAVDDVKTLLPADTTIDHASILELVTLFADTWFSLDAYDKDKLISQGTTKKKVTLTADKLNKALAELKQNLISKNEATDIFGVERTKDSIAGIIGNVMQSFGGEELYPSIEEKAAHLLYFIVKNHPFVDGNKRSGAYSFVWFLRQAKALDLARITPPALTAITLLIAESSPKDKDKMIGLVCTLLAKRKQPIPNKN